MDTVNQRTKLRCLVQGIDENDLKAQRMPYLSQIEFFERGQEMKEGDLLVTSGVGKMYPSGIPVGHVTEIKIGDAGFFENSLVVPSVDFAKLGSLYVLLDLKK